ncbi:hypothetical protein HRbin36_01664 [bacterium HR36]|nr:hypothetical protein HRbin36_01664 [bacterium HR36]
MPFYLTAPHKPQEFAREIGQPLAFLLESANALQGTTFAVRFWVLKLFAEQLQVEAECTKMVLQLVDNPASEIGEFLVTVGSVSAGVAADTGLIGVGGGLG